MWCEPPAPILGAPIFPPSMSLPRDAGPHGGNAATKPMPTPCTYPLRSARSIATLNVGHPAEIGADGTACESTSHLGESSHNWLGSSDSAAW